MNITFSQSEVWANESPKPVRAGSTLNISCTFWGAPSSVTAKVFKNKTDVTSTTMPSGSVGTPAGNSVTLKPLTAMVGTNRYVVEVTATVGGEVHVKTMMLICSKTGIEQ